MHCALGNGADLCVNEGQWLSVKLVSLKERIFAMSGPVPLCIPEGSISHVDNDSET